MILRFRAFYCHVGRPIPARRCLSGFCPPAVPAGRYRADMTPMIAPFFVP